MLALATCQVRGASSATRVASRYSRSSTPPCVTSAMHWPRCASASRATAATDALAKGLQHLAAARPELRIAPAPARRLVRPALLDLREAQAFELTERALAQADVDLRLQPLSGRQRRSGLVRTRQIAAVHGVNLLVPERLRQPAGLPSAHGIESDVGMTLNAAVRVPGSLAVADGQDARRLAHRRRLAARRPTPPAARRRARA